MCVGHGMGLQGTQTSPSSHGQRRSTRYVHPILFCPRTATSSSCCWGATRHPCQHSLAAGPMLSWLAQLPAGGCHDIKCLFPTLSAIGYITSQRALPRRGNFAIRSRKRNCTFLGPPVSHSCHRGATLLWWSSAVTKLRNPPISRFSSRSAAEAVAAFSEASTCIMSICAHKACSVREAV